MPIFGSKKDATILSFKNQGHSKYQIGICRTDSIIYFQQFLVLSVAKNLLELFYNTFFFRFLE